MQPKIFLSYRREDSAFAVGRISDLLATRFDRGSIFMDVDSIRAGDDFRLAIDNALSKSDVVLTVMGDRWLSCQDTHGRKRLDSPGDFVRVELATALKRGVPVIPLLIGEAQMPSATQMPEDIRDLAFRHALRLRPEPDFANDAAALVQAIVDLTDSQQPDADHAEATPVDGEPGLAVQFFRATRRGAQLVVEVTHETFVDPATCNRFADQVRELLDREATNRLVMETSRVELLSSCFLGILIQLLGRCQKRGGRLIVVTTSLMQRELFRLHHLESFFGVTEHLDEALARLSGELNPTPGKAQ